MKKRFRIVLSALALLLAILAFNACKENNSLEKHKKFTAAHSLRKVFSIIEPAR